MLRLSKPCVVVQICEGLGNQLFSYAAARALALRHNVPLHLDVYSQYRINRFGRKYLLDNYLVDGSKLSVGRSFVGNVGHLIWKSQLFTKSKIGIFCLEKAAHVDKELIKRPISGINYLVGYWQYEEYFKDYASQIRKDLALRYPPSIESTDMSQLIQAANSICLHIRTYKEIKADVSPLLGYYLKAVDYITARVPNAHFFVFSDDQNWVRKNLNIRAAFTLVDIRSGPGYDRAVEDLWLMSMCKHHVLSSSSFSWWAAWLRESEDKIVVVPRESFFFKKGSFPERWIAV